MDACRRAQNSVSDTPYVPAQGDFIWVAVDPRIDQMTSDDLPALVLSQLTFSAATGFALIAPVTSRIRGWPFEVVLSDGLSITGAVLVDQTRSIDITAGKVRFLARASPDLLAEALGKLGAIIAPDGLPS